MFDLSSNSCLSSFVYVLLLFLRKPPLLCDSSTLEITLDKSKLNYKPVEVLDFFKKVNFKTLINKYEKKSNSQMKFKL